MIAPNKWQSNGNEWNRAGGRRPNENESAIPITRAQITNGIPMGVTKEGTKANNDENKRLIGDSYS